MSDIDGHALSRKLIVFLADHKDELGEHAREEIRGLVQEIDDHRRELEAQNRSVLESEHRFRELFDRMSSGVAIYRAVDNGRDFVFIGFNNAGQRIEQIGKEELVGRRVTEVFPGISEFGLLDVLRRVWRSGDPEHHPIQQYKDGRISGWRENFVYRLPSGEVVAVYDDLTEKKRAEQVIRESERELSTLMGNLPGMAYHCLNTPQWTMNFVSEGCFLLTGYRSDELIADKLVPYADLINEDDRRQVWDNIQAALEENRRFEIEYRITTRTGEEKWVWERGVGITDEHGTVSSLEGFITDITEKILLEEQLRQVQKMEAVGRLAGGVAHDFNNLLTAILGYSELLQLGLDEKDPMWSSVKEIEKAGTRAASLTRQLLAFSRKQVLQPKILEINEVVGGMERMLNRLIGEDVELVTTLRPDAGFIEADQGQIEQVLMNLILNAREAMPEGGKVLMETCPVDFDVHQDRDEIEITPGPFLEIRVSDTGSGMSEETLDHIFEPFFTTKPEGQGTGLGLATVHGIVKQSGGFIEVESEPGAGSLFKIYLPLFSRETDQAGIQPVPADALEGNETILVVEDEQLVRRLACQTLRIRGYNVLEAANGGSALLKCERSTEPIDLILTDVIMPEMKGRELVDRLLTIQPGMKVIYMSGYSDLSMLPEEVSGGSINFLQKPFLPLALVRKIREILDAPPDVSQA